MSRKKKSRKKRRSNPKRRSHGHRARGHKKNPHRRRRRHRNPMGPIVHAAVGALAGIAGGLAVSAALSYAPVSGTMKTVIRAALGAAGLVGGVHFGHPLVGVGLGTALAYPSVRDTLRQIPGLESVPVGDDQIGAVHRLRGAHPPQLRSINGAHPAQVRGVG